MEIIIKKAITAHNEGKLEEAENLYRSILKIKKIGSEHSSVYNNFGATLQMLGKLEDAEINYKKAIELKSDYAEVFRKLYKLQKLKKNPLLL